MAILCAIAGLLALMIVVIVGVAVYVRRRRAARDMYKADDFTGAVHTWPSAAGTLRPMPRAPASFTSFPLTHNSMYNDGTDDVDLNEVNTTPYSETHLPTADSLYAVTPVYTATDVAQRDGMYAELPVMQSHTADGTNADHADNAGYLMLDGDVAAPTRLQAGAIRDMGFENASYGVTSVGPESTIRTTGFENDNPVHK